MSTPVRASDRDLRALAAIVGEDRPDLPDGEGLPPSLLADLMGQIRCDQVVFVGFDGGRQAYWFAQEDPFKVPFTDTPGWEDFDRTCRLGSAVCGGASGRHSMRWCSSPSGRS